MILNSFRNYSRRFAACLARRLGGGGSIRGLFIFAASSLVLAGSALAAPAIKNVVLVHGAFVDGSGWQPVYDILTKDGYHVTRSSGTAYFFGGRCSRYPPNP